MFDFFWRGLISASVQQKAVGAGGLFFYCLQNEF